MLKNSASGVLASFRDSTYRSVPLAASLVAHVLGSFFEHPTGYSSLVLEMPAIEVLLWRYGFSAAYKANRHLEMLPLGGSARPVKEALHCLEPFADRPAWQSADSRTR